jgi:AAA+ superfamily predicted ATPase
MIETINLLEPSADFLAPGDRIHQVDGVSTVGLTNDQVMNMLLCNHEENAVIEIEYSLPDYRKLRQIYQEIILDSFYQQFHKIACASRQNWHR